MDVYSSGEEPIIKTRKPYTITKQRERWTEEEHNRFLEALKLHGRAWQRIEEHIGTKTAVQIRSHAQKFFSKLEKEALVKGVPIAQAIDIEIPPPRPKRKPSNPYPRKTGAISSPNTQVKAKDGNQIPPGSIHTTEQVLDSEKEQLAEEAVGGDAESSPKETDGSDKCSTEAFTLLRKAPSALGTSSNEVPAMAVGSARKLSNFMEFVPIKKPVADNETRDLNAAAGHNRNHKPDKSDVVDMIQNDSENETNAAKTFPRHAPVHILDGNLGSCSQGLSSDVSYQEPAFHHMGIPDQPSLFSNPTVSAAVESQTSTSRSTNHQIFPNSHPPFSPFPNNQENYSSFLQMSSTFSSMIVSALLQNPAAHTAASFAASFWPCAIENSANSTVGGYPHRQMNPTPSVAEIAAATVAAATAWWAAHGLLPLCTPPVHAGFSLPPTSVSAPLANFGQTPVANEEREEIKNSQVPEPQVQQCNQELSEALQPQHSASKSSATSSPDSGNITSAKMDVEVAADNNEKNNVPASSEQKDANKGKSKKQVDRSSCGSNTPSGSDIETDALKKNDLGKEEANEPDVSRPTTSEPSSRRNRLIGNIYESWKEVSEGGRLAFQALFSREVLPQSFSPPLNVTGKNQEVNVTVGENRNNAEKGYSGIQFDLNSNAWEFCSSNQGIENLKLREEDNRKEGLLTFSLEHGNLNTTNRTGFKPYKRCSVEAIESTAMNSNAQQEKCSKRLRLDGEAST
ncbi:hypothetical protein SOVF_161680 isoform A [Spinacia oleracea]|uniref:Protein LATE ELONGATED HYPOCOTYL isoform X3 n=1 Tax=Spinacia oleracea TaxID=3562 RepID=A0A9R0IB65_SPIOL|nr:protein LATE ELONGATED HYPOCOTYL isoform X3 [Spinacia oleracea]XP_056693662.1 protein LATE ELONGATED HYPOCOTYL isoform X3 [Spinacia oleracea]KNA08541.1 hypothetical protein SOVF_161680 isoform A [Spinacia oleracea]